MILEPPSLEALTPTKEAEAAALLAVLFAGVASRRSKQRPLKEAA